MKYAQRVSVVIVSLIALYTLPRVVAARSFDLTKSFVENIDLEKLVKPKIVIEKAKRKLSLYDGAKLVKTYRIALGSTPVGDKERQGDRKTPEGEFYICQKNAKSTYYLSLGISYPSTEDAERGLREGLINKKESKEIKRAIAQRKTPLWNTALGGEIFIHGNGSSTDWTWGCIALEDADVKELFDAIPVRTPVTVMP